MKASYPSTGGRGKTIEAPGHRLRLQPSPQQESHGRRRFESADRPKLEQLIQRIEQLKAQNHLLLANERAWREERAHLIEKNEMARLKVESMISRLKALEQDS